MKIDKDVIFREFKGEILALFPYDIGNYEGDVTCYAHIGQHGSTDYKYIISNSKPINNPKRLDLYYELENIGYNLKPIKRQNYSRYLDELYKTREL